MSTPPIYGATKTPCPATPAANTSLLEYMNRTKGILLQLNEKKDKTVALTRIDILITEVTAALQ
jgi:hypothetical protein